VNKNFNTAQQEAFFKGESREIEILYKVLLPKVTSFILKNKGSIDDATEIFQEALFQIIARSRVKSIKINTSLEAYIYTVCRNLWYQELKKRKKEVRNEGIFELKSEDDTVYAMMQQDRWDLFEKMFLKLSENCQKLLKAYFDKVSYDKIKDTFKYATKNTAFQRIFKCKKRLTELVQGANNFKNL